MDKIAQRREDIYDYFHSTNACRKYFFDASHKEQYVAYYNSMYLLQDSTESLLVHRQRGFSEDPHLAYLEFWGIMQAAIIQQDSVAEIHAVVADQSLDAKAKNLPAWLGLRELRNICAGHPAKRDRPKSEPLTRTFMGRRFGNYNEVTYEKWEHGSGITHPRVPLGTLFNAYASEVEIILSEILAKMKERWPP